MKRRTIVVGLMALALAVGVLVVRASGDGSAKGSQRRPAASAGNDNAPGRGPGQVDGTRSEEGARAAAMRFASASQDWLYLSDDDMDRAVRAAATPASAEQLSRDTIEELGASRDQLAKAAGRVWWLVRPLASRVERFDHDTARVSVWTVTVLSAADVALPQADWLRVAVDLVWMDGEWKLQALSDTPGPTPATGTKDRAWQPEPFDQALDGYQRAASEPDR